MTAGAYQSLSTGDLTAFERVRRWNAFGSETLSDIDVEPDDKDHFSATLSRRTIGQLGLTWMTTTPAVCHSRPGRVGPWAAPAKDAFLLNIQETGRMIGRHNGRESVAGPGDMVLLDCSRLWVTEAPEPLTMTMLKLPAAQAMAAFGDPDTVCGVPLSCASPKVALASSLILSVKRAVAEAPEADWGEHVEQLILEAVAVALETAFAVADPCPRSAGLRREACAFIERNLEDPELAVGSIAEALGASTRSVQRVFMDVGQTPRGYILERRLATAAERLRQCGTRAASITDIAFGVGFSDLSYFTRSFRRKLGVSPREYRNRRAGAH
jgi:AraC-like DNA-binding protein